MQTEILDSRLNRPRGRFSENSADQLNRALGATATSYLECMDKGVHDVLGHDVPDGDVRDLHVLLHHLLEAAGLLLDQTAAKDRRPAQEDSS